MRRLIPLLLVVATLAGACGGSDAPADEPAASGPGGTSTSSEVAGAGGPGAPPEAGPETTAGQPPAGDAGGGGASAPTTGPAPGPPGQGAPGPGSPGPDQPTATTERREHLGPPGSFAGVLLRPQPAEALFLEVLVQDGVRPSSGAISRLEAELARVSGKPVSTMTGVVPGERTEWSAAAVREAADANAGMPQGGRGAVIRLLYLRGSSTDADGALGVAVRGDVAAVFADEVRRAATPLIGSDAIERAVSLHEVGHLLGLVDLFLQTGRADPEHPGHSPSDRSVMYWAVETGLFADISGDLPQDFDADDLADLATIRRG